MDSASARSILEPGTLEVEAALASMTPTERLRLFWRAQDVALARSWALVERSGPSEPCDRIRFVIRARYPEWSVSEVERLLDAIVRHEEPAAWLERLRSRALAASERFAAD